MKHRIPSYCLLPERHSGNNEICRPLCDKAFVRNDSGNNAENGGEADGH